MHGIFQTNCQENMKHKEPLDLLFLLQSKFLLQHILQFHIKPFGICAGSEKQGGQHEGRDKPVGCG
jgi:hypothetical protein